MKHVSRELSGALEISREMDISRHMPEQAFVYLNYLSAALRRDIFNRRLEG